MTDLLRHKIWAITLKRRLTVARQHSMVTAFGVPGVALVLEVLPVAGVVLLLTAWIFGYATLIQPIWWYLVLALAAYIVGQWSFSHRLMSILTIALALILWVGTLLGSVVLSSDAYRHLPLDVAISAFVRDLGDGSIGPQLTKTMLGITFLTTYLWWRGLILSRQRLTRDRLFGRFRTGSVVLVATIFIAQPLPRLERDSVNAGLALLLPIEIFVGLIGVALAHLADVARIREERQRERNREGSGSGSAERVEGTWLVMVLAVSGSIVAVALVATLLIWNNGGQDLSLALARLFTKSPSVSPLPGGTSGGSGSVARPAPGVGAPTLGRGLSAPNSSWLILLLGVAVVVITLFLWMRLRERHSREKRYEEKREWLNARDALRARWRMLTSLSWPGSRKDSVTDEEALSAGSIRELYREVLRSAAHVGRGRPLNETPVEYARRLVAEAAHVSAGGGGSASPVCNSGNDDNGRSTQKKLNDAMELLTDTYCRVRYGAANDNPPAGASGQLRDAQQQVIHWLKRPDSTS